MATTHITVETSGRIKVNGLSNRRKIKASKNPLYPEVRIDMPAGPRTTRTVTLLIELPELIHITRELSRGLA